MLIKQTLAASAHIIWVLFCFRVVYIERAISQYVYGTYAKVSIKKKLLIFWHAHALSRNILLFFMPRFLVIILRSLQTTYYHALWSRLFLIILLRFFFLLSNKTPFYSSFGALFFLLQLIDSTEKWLCAHHKRIWIIDLSAANKYIIIIKVMWGERKNVCLCL